MIAYIYAYNRSSHRKRIRLENIALTYDEGLLTFMETAIVIDPWTSHSPHVTRARPPLLLGLGSHIPDPLFTSLFPLFTLIPGQHMTVQMTGPRSGWQRRQYPQSEVLTPSNARRSKYLEVCLQSQRGRIPLRIIDFARAIYLVRIHSCFPVL